MRSCGQVIWLLWLIIMNILVLCTGNSCRSIMAEALFNHFGKGRFHAVSAGSWPTGFVHPMSLETLSRHGILMPENPESKSWDIFAGKSFDLVVTVCDQAAGESCPIFFGSPEKLHWSIPDPAKSGTTEAFDKAFYMLKERIESLVNAKAA